MDNLPHPQGKNPPWGWPTVRQVTHRLRCLPGLRPAPPASRSVRKKSESKPEADGLRPGVVARGRQAPLLPPARRVGGSIFRARKPKSEKSETEESSNHAGLRICERQNLTLERQNLDELGQKPLIFCLSLDIMRPLKDKTRVRNV